MRAKDATWEQRVVAELEAALSGWFRCIPVHCEFKHTIACRRQGSNVYHSAMGTSKSFGSILVAICHTLRCVLRSADSYSQTVYTLPSELRRTISSV